MTAATVHITRNFDRNLEAIRTYLEGNEVPEAFDPLLGMLFEEVIPDLESFPEIGSDFLRHTGSSLEAVSRGARLRDRLGPEVGLRELIRGDYLLLYARRGGHVYLVAIKHHRQLSYDLPAFWPR